MLKDQKKSFYSAPFCTIIESIYIFTAKPCSLRVCITHLKILGPGTHEGSSDSNSVHSAHWSDAGNSVENGDIIHRMSFLSSHVTRYSFAKDQDVFKSDITFNTSYCPTRSGSTRIPPALRNLSSRISLLVLLSRRVLLAKFIISE